MPLAMSDGQSPPATRATISISVGVSASQPEAARCPRRPRSPARRPGPPVRRATPPPDQPPGSAPQRPGAGPGQTQGVRDTQGGPRPPGPAGSPPRSRPGRPVRIGTSGGGREPPGARTRSVTRIVRSRCGALYGRRTPSRPLCSWLMPAVNQSTSVPPVVAVPGSRPRRPGSVNGLPVEVSRTWPVTWCA
jgi:hypothetical protein